MTAEDNDIDPEEIVEIRQDVGGGILSKGQTDYLVRGADELGLSNNAEKQRRKKIRRNFRSAVPDLALLGEMSDKDKFETFAPLLDPEIDIERALFNIGSLNQQELDHFDPSNMMENDDMTFAIQQGIRELMELYVFLVGPQKLARLAQKSIDQAQIEISDKTNRKVPMYHLNLERATMEERFEAIKEEFPASIDS